jgi:hypothetical protein
VDNAQAVENTARHFVEALAAGEDVTPYLADGLDWLAAEPTERLGTIRAELDVRRLDVVRLEAGAATVEAVAEARQVLEHPVHGSLEFEYRFDGRIELERVGDEWRVADYTNKGRSLHDAVVRPAGALEHGTLTLVVPALTLATESTRIVLAVENRGPHLVVLSELYRGAKALGLWHYVPVPFVGAVEVPSGSRVVTNAGWRERFRLRTPELRFLLRAGEADGPGRFELAFSVRRTPEPQLVRIDRPPLLLRLPRRVTRLVQAAPAAVLVALLLLHELRTAGVVLLLYGTALGAALGVWFSRGRPVRGLVVPVIGTVAVGAWLVWTGGSFGS